MYPLIASVTLMQPADFMKMNWPRNWSTLISWPTKMSGWTISFVATSSRATTSVGMATVAVVRRSEKILVSSMVRDRRVVEKELSASDLWARVVREEEEYNWRGLLIEVLHRPAAGEAASGVMEGDFRLQQEELLRWANPCQWDCHTSLVISFRAPIAQSTNPWGLLTNR
jgi:hypothetical protein